MYFPFGSPSSLVVEFFNLFNHSNVAHINPVIGMSAMQLAGFLQPIADASARRIKFSLAFEF